jgi:hypothetical protein
VSSNHSDRLGAFPCVGPLTYIAHDAVHAREGMHGDYPKLRRWFHATTEEAAASAAWQGLVPGCWRGGDCCCVCGYDSLDDVPTHRVDWVLEIYSRANVGQAKAWWVPPQAIRGAWTLGVFYEATELRERGEPLLGEVGGCACDLSELTREQALLWRAQPVR